MSTAAPPVTSGSDETLDVMTGEPAAMADDEKADGFEITHTRNSKSGKITGSTIRRVGAP